MRIAISTEAFYPACDADTRTVKAVVDQLIDAGHDILLLAPAPGLGDYRGATVARVTLLEGRGAQVREAMLNFGADALISVSPTKIGRKALKHARRLDVPTLVVQAAPVTALDAELWTRTVGARADLLVVTAPWMQQRVAELGVADAPVWEPGVDALAFTPALRDDYLHDSYAKARAKGGARIVVGHAGDLRRRHGVRRLVDAARVPGGRLVIIGEGPQRTWLEGQVSDAKFAGALSSGELATALASLDILVQPSEIETCGHLVRAALASGVPVIAPNAGGSADIVRDGETGILYDPEEPKALRKAVSHLLACPELRERLGKKAREESGTRDWSLAITELIETHLARALQHKAIPAA
jgi:phosphatidylinositol alpha 1,6-mannosyltransferase